MSNSEKKKGLPVIKYRGECPMHHPLDEGYGPLVCKQCADEEIAKLKAALAEETKIVDRIWDILGRPSYEELAGRSIYDLISGLQKELADERARLRELAENIVEWYHEIPFSLYRGSCGHYWDSAEVGIERCPVCAELAEEEGRIADMEQSFELRWKADQRAIKMWQKAHPGNDRVWPDHADLCVWLMERLSEERARKQWIYDQCNDPGRTPEEIGRRLCAVIAGGRVRGKIYENEDAAIDAAGEKP